MYLQHLKIANYKSFLQPTDFEFRPGFNVLLGANSSGKSSVLEAISFPGFQNVPHRSILNASDPDVQINESAMAELDLNMSISEIQNLVNQNQPLYIGVGERAGEFAIQDTAAFQEMLSSNVGFKVGIRLVPGHSGPLLRIQANSFPSVWRDLNQTITFPAAQVHQSVVSQITNFQLGGGDIRNIWDRLGPKMFRLTSERTVQQFAPHQSGKELMPNAANLAFCINLLSTSNPHLFEELNALLHRVFPTIHWVGSVPNGSNQFELTVHTNPTYLKRADLAVPFNRVGTGVGNALAMLYVALTSQTQRFILLEEPNSYLHPRALRELLAILAEVGSQHQYFITTHSSDVLRTVKASTVTLLEHDGVQTTIKQTSGDKLHELQAGLVELGISLTDLHGCDKVLWTEGETEAAIFPMLLRHFFPELAQGIAVLPLHATGDFEARKFEPQKVAAIYKTLSAGSFLAPPMVAITLDREKKPDSLIRKIEEDSDGVIHFLPKTMLEDYLLDASAITQVINDSYGLSISEEQVSNALTKAFGDVENRLFPKNPEDTTIHAAKVLERVFANFPPSTGHPVPAYRKTADGPKIAEYLLRHKPVTLMPLKEWFQSFIDGMDTNADPA